MPRNTRTQLSLAAALSLLLATTASAAATGPDRFLNGQSYFGEPAGNTATLAPRTVDIGAARYVNAVYGETITFRSGGQQFSWTFNGLDRRAIDLARIAPAGFTAQRLMVYIGENPYNRP